VIGAENTDRRSRLRALKLQTLVRDHVGAPVAATPGVFPLGAAFELDATAWVLLEEDPERGLGPALAWAIRNGADHLELLADHGTGVLARRAEQVRLPVDVWHVEGRALLPAVAEPAAAPPSPSDAHVALMPTMVAAGAIPVVEHGVVSGEVRGLEVCRVVDDPQTGAVRLEVGVGAHDREAFAIVHGDVPTVEALAGVVDAVKAHRSPGTPHPLNRLAPERLLRWRLEQEPSLVGLASVAPTQPPVPRRNVKDRTACSAIGHRTDGTEVLVICSVGVDLDLVPYAIDARLHEPGVDGEVMVVLPSRDLVAVTLDLAALADQALSLVGVSA